MDKRPKPLRLFKADDFCVLILRRCHRLFCVFGRKIYVNFTALVFLLGLAAAALCSRIGLPRIIGMLLTGILIGPYVS